MVFVEQQLYDVAMYLSIEGLGGSVLFVLLLADNVAVMSGILGEVWRNA